MVKNSIFDVTHFIGKGRIKPGTLGESLQADFVVKVLKTIFPKAKFPLYHIEKRGWPSAEMNRLEQWRRQYPKRKVVHITIKIDAEYGNKHCRRPTDYAASQTR